MKKLIPLLFLSGVMALLASCGGTPAETAAPTAAPSTTDVPKTDPPVTTSVGTVLTDEDAAFAVTAIEDPLYALNEGETSYEFTRCEYYHNYIEVFDLNGNVYRIGDPFITRYDGYYYLYTSVTSGHINGDIYVWRSENLIDWTCQGIVLTSSGTTGNTYTAFAPEVVYYHGSFWLCESANGKGHYIFRSDLPTGPFTAVSGNLGKTIDGHFYLDDNGNLFFLYAQSANGGSILFQRIDVEATSDAAMIASAAGSVLKGYLNGWTEGPGHFRRGNYFYLTYTGNHVREKSYRVGYSYTKASTLISGLVQPENNITLLSTDLVYTATKGYGSKSNYDKLEIYSGLGHSCNILAPDLDGIYTAYHNEESGTFNRRLNITRYFTNGALVTANGLCTTDVRKPELADYVCRDESALVSLDGARLSATATPKVFTAEFNFRASGDAASLLLGVSGSSKTVLTVTADKLTVTKNGTEIATANLGKGNKLTSLVTVRVVNGADKCEIYFNEMRKLVLKESLDAGQIGLGDGAVFSSLFFSDEAFGTSDFETVKNLPCTFPAYAYLKGENRGFSIAAATVTKDGVRQGEKESTVELDTCYAVALEAGDWVKYAVSSGKNDWYSLILHARADSVGTKLELVVDEKTVFPMTVTACGVSGYANVSVGVFPLDKGEHTLKLRVVEGTLAMTQITLENGAEPMEIIEVPLTKRISNLVTRAGQYSVSSTDGLTTKDDGYTMLTFKNSVGVSDFIYSIDVTAISASRMGGIVFRVSDYNDNRLGTYTYCFNGYYLQFKARSLTLWRYNWQTGEKLATVNFHPGTTNRIYNAGDTLSLTVKAVGGQITVWVGDEEILSVFDEDAFLSGSCGIFTELSSFTFKNAKIEQLNPQG